VDIKRIHNILVPTDFSDAAAEAERTAVSIAQAFDAKIELLYVTATVVLLPPPFETATFPSLMPELNARLQQRLDEEKKRVDATGVRCETQLLEGVPHMEIVNRAQASGVDLIVMGTHGHGGFAHAVLGSVAERVLHRSRCPVLVVPVRR
jgi:nucleotide-binding universal stress UspA family protein